MNNHHEALHNMQKPAKPKNEVIRSDHCTGYALSIDTKGRVTIPAEVRKDLELDEGDAMGNSAVLAGLFLLTSNLIIASHTEEVSKE